MKLLNPIRLSVGLAALFVAQSGWAAGTQAGTLIENTATLSYSVGGTPQSEIKSDVSDFVVDRKVDLTVTGDKTLDVSDPNEPAGTYEVSPLSDGTDPATAPATAVDPANKLLYKLKNEGNSSQAFEVGVANLTGDDFEALDCHIEITDETNTNVTGPTPITGTDPIVIVPEDTEYNIYVTCDMPDIESATVPTGVADNDLATLEVTATAVVSETDNTAMTESGTDAEDTVDTVLADDTGTGDADRDAKHSDTQTYEIAAPDMSVEKTSAVISDPFNGSTNPKRIPGAIVEYTIRVTNDSSTAVDDVTISDIIQDHSDTAYNVNTTTGSIITSGETVNYIGNSTVTVGGTLTSDTVAFDDPSDTVSVTVDVPEHDGTNPGEVVITFQVQIL